MRARDENQLIDQEVVVVGSGLAGLTAAAVLSRNGRRVTVIEQSRETGGRARTSERHKVLFNLGPHALYCQGEAWRVLKSLNVPFRGAFPNPGRSTVFSNGTAHQLPQGLLEIIKSSWLSLADKWRLLRLLSSLAKLETAPLQSVPLSNWVRSKVGHGAAADFLHLFFRLTTYANEPELTSAGAAIDQFRLGLNGSVWYLDGGWQTLIAGLSNVVVQAGGTIQASARATNVESQIDGVTISLASGETLSAQAVVLAVSPEDASQLLGFDETASRRIGWDRCRPIRAACLDVALKQLPVPEIRFALRADQPYYFSVHSAAARLAEPETVVLHVMKYLSAEADTTKIEQELSNFLSEVQPGWQEHRIDSRCLPNMIVSHALPMAEHGGLAGRPEVCVHDHSRVFVAGDWVGARGMLADASAASGEEAAKQVLRLLDHDRLPFTRSKSHAVG